ncbi:unnamed protein product [Staurois parvus]|uniref:Uncharacterized protein n=1 Tax=Staurois parvus TaxID=386267 RepID=A0ABN9GYP1_9NEOB|nr:unnamed protein product [Staurois parvus]
MGHYSSPPLTPMMGHYSPPPPLTPMMGHHSTPHPTDTNDGAPFHPPPH